MNLFKNKQERELKELEARSDALVADLQAHLATEPAMREQYVALDDACIRTAAEVTSYTVARSPRLAHAQAELQQLQWSRDGVRITFSRKSDDLYRQIQAINETYIHDFHEWGLATVQDIASFAKSRHTQEWSTTAGGRIIEIEGNHLVLARLRNMILDAIHDVRGHQCASLKEVRTLISRHRAAIQDVDLSEVSKYETNAMYLQGTKPETPIYDKGFLGPDKFIPIAPPADPRVSQFADRLDKLEAAK